MVHRLNAVAVLLALALIAACSSSEDGAGNTQDAGSDAAPDASADVAADVPTDAADAADAPSLPDPDPDLNGVAYDPPACAPYAAVGPHAVGVTTVTIDGSPVEVWYPADRQATIGAERASYDIRDWLPEDEASLVPDEAAPLFALNAWRDIAPDEGGPYPLVMFSHGFAGYRMQSATLLTHIASWGYVVASLEHPERALAQIITSIAPGDDVSVEAVRAMLAGLRAFEAGSTPFAGAIDFDRIAMTGHSAGGGTTLGVFGDDVIDAAIVYAAGSGSLQPTGKPVLFLAGVDDGIIPIGSVRDGYDASTAPRSLIAMARTGHLAFSDICVVGRDEGGILQIASDYGVNVPGILLVLGSDGCGESAEPAEVAWPLIHHASVAFLRQVFGDDEPVTGPDAELATCFGDLVDEQRSE